MQLLSRFAIDYDKNTTDTYLFGEIWSQAMPQKSRARSSSLAWSNPVSWWWGVLTLVSSVNIVAWLLLYRQLHETSSFDAMRGAKISIAGWLPINEVHHTGSSGHAPGLEIMLMLSAAYVFGCAFRSFLPRADVQRICLFDTWLSSVAVGRSVATVAEVCFAGQWAMILLQLGTMADAPITLTAAWVIVPLILIAECFSWYAVVTTKYLYNAIENSLWAVAFFIAGVGLCRLLPEFNGAVRVVLGVAVIGIVFYIVFLITVDVPMYLKRWRADVAGGNKVLSPLEGL